MCNSINRFTANFTLSGALLRIRLFCSVRLFSILVIYKGTLSLTRTRTWSPPFTWNCIFSHKCFTRDDIASFDKIDQKFVLNQYKSYYSHKLSLWKVKQGNKESLVTKVGESWQIIDGSTSAEILL